MSHSVDDDQVDQPTPRDGDEQVLLMWPARVRTLLNGPLWKGLAVAFGSGAALVCVIFLLAGSGSTGLLAQSEKNAFIPYGDVRKIKLGAGRRYVLVKGGFLDKPIGLYCTAENYEPALKILRERCAKATFCGA